MNHLIKKEFQLHDSVEFITLQQLLKSEGIAYSGGSVKIYVEDYLVKINDEPEVRRGRKLYPGDVIVLEEPVMTITITSDESAS